MQPGQLWLCETEVYGLVSGPMWLRETLVEDFTKLGYIQNPYDKCLFSLFTDNEYIEGNVMLDVDDLVEGGSPEHRRRVNMFYTKYKFGKILKIKDAGNQGTLIIGRRVRQHDDGSFELDMTDYATKRLNPIEVERGYLTKTKEVDDDMIQKVRGVVGAINWLACACRPDLAAAASIIPGHYKTRNVAMVSESNAAVRQAKEVTLSLNILSIPIKQWRVVIFTDSGTDTSGNQRHQKCYIVGITNELLNQGEPAPLSVVH